jgi:hypothetical protein
VAVAADEISYFAFPSRLIDFSTQHPSSRGSSYHPMLQLPSYASYLVFLCTTLFLCLCGTTRAAWPVSLFPFVGNLGFINPTWIILTMGLFDSMQTSYGIMKCDLFLFPWFSDRNVLPSFICARLYSHKYHPPPVLSVSSSSDFGAAELPRRCQWKFRF